MCGKGDKDLGGDRFLRQCASVGRSRTYSGTRGYWNATYLAIVDRRGTYQRRELETKWSVRGGLI